MPFSYNGLWKLLIDKGMTKEDLRQRLNLSSATVAKMGKGEKVSMEVIEKICTLFDCRIEEVIEFVKAADPL